MESIARFRVPVDGIFVLNYAKSAGVETIATLYETANASGVEGWKVIQMVKPLNMVDRGAGAAGKWHGELHFIPISADKYYGIYFMGAIFEICTTVISEGISSPLKLLEPVTRLVWARTGGDPDPRPRT